MTRSLMMRPFTGMSPSLPKNATKSTARSVWCKSNQTNSQMDEQQQQLPWPEQYESSEQTHHIVVGEQLVEVSLKAIIIILATLSQQQQQHGATVKVAVRFGNDKFVLSTGKLHHECGSTGPMTATTSESSHGGMQAATGETIPKPQARDSRQ